MSNLRTKIMEARSQVKMLILDGFWRRATSGGVGRAALVAAVGAVLFLPQVAWAQGGSGFLFDQPRASVGVRVGYSFPALDSDLFDFTREQFTLGNSDFRNPYFGGEVAVRVADRVDLVGDFGWTRSRSSSEYRDFEDTNDLPIEQETTFKRTSLTFGGKYYLTTRGRSVGQFAWIPSRITPYVGGGVGVMWYDFMQVGDFIDFDTLDIFRDNIQTSGASAIADVRVGTDFSLSRRVVLTGEARYHFGSDSTGGDYVGFANTDLSGLTVMFGVSFRF